MKCMKRVLSPMLIIVFVNCIVCCELDAQKATTFTNPLFSSGADPWCIYKDGHYYYTHTTGHNVTLWRTKSIATLRDGKKKVVFTPPAKGPYSKEIWAPEIHFLKNKWYIYFAADSGNNVDHRLWVLENKSKNPLRGKWKLKAKLTTPGDKWSIDGSVYDHNGQLYLVWSGWEGDVNGEQNIYIAPMSNPWTVSGERVRISKPHLEWETHGDLNNPNDVPHVNVNEGPQIIPYKDKLFLIYSASGCWTDFYSLGMLSIDTGAVLTDSASWTKHPYPVFTQNPTDGVYAPGHNSFFMSPDGTEHWILYHANSEAGQGCGKQRSPRAQPFTWRQDGTPDFGTPIPTGVPVKVPSGSKK